MLTVAVYTKGDAIALFAIDSAIVTFGMGTGSQRLLVAVPFVAALGICDGAASAFALHLSASPAFDALSTAIGSAWYLSVAYLIAVIALGYALGKRPVHRALLVATPLLLASDNLFEPARGLLFADPLTSGVIAGTASCAFAVVGYLLAVVPARHLGAGYATSVRGALIVLFGLSQFFKG